MRGKRRPVEHEVVTTAHGPVVAPLAAGETRTLALQWTALAPARNVARFRGLGRARTADDVVAALSGVGGPTLNCVYATLAGDVGYQMCGGPVPLRASRRRPVPDHGAVDRDGAVRGAAGMAQPGGRHHRDGQQPDRARRLSAT